MELEAPDEVAPLVEVEVPVVPVVDPDAVPVVELVAAVCEPLVAPVEDVEADVVLEVVVVPEGPGEVEQAVGTTQESSSRVLEILMKVLTFGRDTRRSVPPRSRRFLPFARRIVWPQWTR